MYSLPANNTFYLYNMNSLQSPVTCLITFVSVTALRSRLNKYYSFHFANEETKALKIFNTHANLNSRFKESSLLSNILSTIKLQTIVSLKNEIK